MQKLTDELTLDKGEKRSKKTIWGLVRKLRDPYLESNTTFARLTENQVNARITQVRKEYYNGNDKVRWCKKDHGPESGGGTGLLQTSLLFYNRDADNVQQMLVLSILALLNLFSSANVSNVCV